jgi:hypothetical protein
MEGNHASTYTVSWVPKALTQAKDLLLRAKSIGIFDEVAQALLAAELKLTTMPLEWGDALYRAKLPGGLVCRGHQPPIYLHYVVYEAQRVVIVHDVT